MASIKKLKSGVKPCSEAGESVISASAASLTLNWGNMSTTPLIEKQANASHAVSIRKQGP